MPTKNTFKMVELLEMISMSATLLGLTPIEWRTVTWLSTTLWEKCSHYQQERIKMLKKVDRPVRTWKSDA